MSGGRDFLFALMDDPAPAPMPAWFHFGIRLDTAADPRATRAWGDHFPRFISGIMICSSTVAVGLGRHADAALERAVGHRDEIEDQRDRRRDERRDHRVQREAVEPQQEARRDRDHAEQDHHTHSAPGSAVSPTACRRSRRISITLLYAARPARARSSGLRSRARTRRARAARRRSILSVPLGASPCWCSGHSCVDHVTRVLDQRVPRLVPQRLRIAAQVVEQHGDRGRLLGDVVARIAACCPRRRRR